MKRILFFLLVPSLFISSKLNAQDGNTQVSYSNLALQFSSWDFNGDAGTGLFPSVASPNGYGSFADNPASIAFIENGYVSFSLFNNRSDYENSYLGNTIKAEDQSTKLGNLGFVYKMPTEQGSFVLGGGYNQISNEREVYRVGGRNSESTITDVFREPSSDYYDIAFDTYAIDWGDVDSTYLESIFRIGFQEYPGITQDAEITHTTNIGEYSFFFGTEFQKNLFVGISAGLTAGNYTYRRDFLELDDRNDYNFNFIPSDVSDEGTDIHSILTHDEIDAEILGFSLRSGLIYKVNPKLNIGVSYLFPSTLVVRESYYSSIRTELDDNSTPFEADFASGQDYEYRISRPGELKAGIALNNIGKFNFSVSGEMINYSNLELDLVSGNDLDFDQEVELRDEEESLESFMGSSYQRVINLKGGIGFDVNDDVTLKAGYGYLPGKSNIYEADRYIISGGFSARVAENIVLDVTGQYSFWSDRSTLYNYFDYSDNVPRSEIVDHEINTLKILAGIKFLF